MVALRKLLGFTLQEQMENGCGFGRVAPWLHNSKDTQVLELVFQLRAWWCSLSEVNFH